MISKGGTSTLIPLTVLTAILAILVQDILRWGCMYLPEKLRVVCTCPPDGFLYLDISCRPEVLLVGNITVDVVGDTKPVVSVS